MFWLRQEQGDVMIRVEYPKFSVEAVVSCLLLTMSEAVVFVIVWKLDLQLPVQSVPITAKGVDSNFAHGDVYSIQNVVIKFVSPVSFTNKTTTV